MKNYTVTVVVGRTAKADASARKVRNWLVRITDLGSHAEGFIRADIQPPEVDRLDEWIVVYEFNSRENLTAWLESVRRRKLIALEPALFQGPPRQQILATPSSKTSVTAVVSFRIKDDEKEVFDQHFHDLVGVLPRFDGFIRCELISAIPGVQDDSIIVFSFTCRESLNAWFDSEERQAFLSGIKPLVQNESTINVVGGFGGWFNSATHPPKKWKQASLVLLALYPTSLLLGWFRQVFFEDLSFAPGVLLVNVLGVAVLSWLLLPPLTKRFGRWLRR